jgi:phospholipase/carboxylesterase
MAHGINDPVVPLHTAKASYQLLVDMGYQIKWFDYPMEHSVSPMEIHDLGKFFSFAFTLKIILHVQQHP